MNIKKQTDLIFEPVKLDSNYPFILPEQSEEVFINIESEVNLHGIYFTRKDEPILLLYFQGNAKNLQNFLDNHSEILSWNYNVLTFDYRGFGKSTGSIESEESMYADSEKIFDYALSLGYRPENIILYGYSMGTSQAAYLSTRRKAKALILESPYSSIAEIEIFGNNAPDFTLNTGQRAKEINIPTLIIHGELDEIITADHAERIYSNLKTANKELVIITKGGHGNLKNREEYSMHVNDFISNTL
ncbi:alpha/beta fold hydrolase [uncultured Chryseobacterium sp.]|uniref:alpha/beta hydrolase n=1 Tax=uncultured Chryseobacterium sp. TaxID=259322 RepID=UPI0025D94661|nr:alpha/beta fold hydrolase [uncultured Chryseobacterium sp.]